MTIKTTVTTMTTTTTMTAMRTTTTMTTPATATTSSGHHLYIAFFVKLMALNAFKAQSA